MSTIKYPSIEQFKNTIRHVKLVTTYDGKDDEGNAIYVNRPLPTLTFTGSVKLHGSHADIRYSLGNDTLVAQSRERDLSLTQDNAGFYSMVFSKEDFWKQVCVDILRCHPDYDTVVIAGEIAGSNIQKGVAINGLPKFFAIFGIRLISSNESTKELWLTNEQIIPEFLNSTGYPIVAFNTLNVYFIEQFGLYSIDIDFNHPELSQNTLVELTTQVGDMCPAGKYFGVEGIGEGIVWTYNNNDTYGICMFKVKDDRHAKGSKVTSLAPVDEESIAKVSDWVGTYVTESRLQQGFHVLKTEKQLDIVDKNVGEYIRWVVQDTMKEEQQSILSNGLDPKKIAKYISPVARNYYFTNMEG